MQRVNLTILNVVLLIGFSTEALNAAQTAKRLHQNIDQNRTFVLKGNIHPSIFSGSAQDLGAVSSEKNMPKMAMHFAMTPAQQADLNQLLTAQQDRRSPQFHKFLTPEEYAARFGLNTADIAKISEWLAGNGFSEIQPARSRMWVEFKGTAGQVETSFHTAIHNYSVNGESHFANATEPQLPVALDGIVAGIKGLHNFLAKPHSRLKPHFTSSISGDTFVVPDDWTTIYDVKPLYGAGLDGSPIANSAANYCVGGTAPCSIVVVGQSDVNASDLANFRSAAGLPAKTITTLVPPGDSDPGLQLASGDESESDLDLEWAGAIAKNANILFVTADTNTGNGVEDAWTWAIDNSAAPILSTSYGLCEVQNFTTPSSVTMSEALFAQAAAEGMSVVSASGDAGAADCDSGYPASLGLAVDYPASSAYVTGIGGTEFTVGNVTGAYWGTSNNTTGGSALQYIPEIVWNDTSVANGLSAGGGGASSFIAKPSWQTGLGVPNDGHRDVPDIALAASIDIDEILICTPVTETVNGTVILNPGVSACSNGFRNSDSTVNVIGGTSAGAPTFAGILALLVQQQGARLGNVNPNLYTVAGVSQTAFHDITNGNNEVPCTVGTLNCNGGTMGYAAGIGYDQASGWGSIDAYNLFEQWSADIQITSSPTVLSIQPGASSTATITVAPVKNFTGTVSFACSVSSSLANVTCSLPSTTVTTSGSTTVTITAASTAGSPLLRWFRNLPPSGPAFFLIALMLAAMLYTFRKRPFVNAWGAVAMLVFVLGAVSCGGSSSSGSTSTGSGSGGTTSPVAESGTVTVTATSGQIVNSVAISVTIP